MLNRHRQFTPQIQIQIQKLLFHNWESMRKLLSNSTLYNENTCSASHIWWISHKMSTIVITTLPECVNSNLDGTFISGEISSACVICPQADPHCWNSCQEYSWIWITCNYWHQAKQRQVLYFMSALLIFDTSATAIDESFEKTLSFI